MYYNVLAIEEIITKTKEENKMKKYIVKIKNKKGEIITVKKIAFDENEIRKEIINGEIIEIKEIK